MQNRACFHLPHQLASKLIQRGEICRAPINVELQWGKGQAKAGNLNLTNQVKSFCLDDPAPAGLFVDSQKSPLMASKIG